MLLNIITGAVGSGKSDYLYNLISENLEKNPDANAILIVPEQFSYNAEKKLSQSFGGLGLNRIEVLTFSRLISRYIKSDKNLSQVGKTVLISKAISSMSKENVYFSTSKKQGLVSSVSELFSEFKRYNITPGDLQDIVLENPLSSKKLAGVLEIYQNYIGFFSENFTDSEDAPGIFADYILTHDTFANTFIFIDKFNDFMPQDYDILKAFLLKSRGIFATLPTADDDPDGITGPVLKTKSRLWSMALSENIQPKEIKLSPKETFTAPDISHLLINWDSERVYDKRCENICVFASRDLYSEVEHSAAKIMELVRKQKLRFRDIGVIVGDMNSYLHILSAVFKESGIPFFCDEKLSVSMHPIARTVLSLFRIIDSNWSYSSVFDYLRTGYVFIKNEDGVSPIHPEDVDILENYVLATGIRGKKGWFSPWTESGKTIFDDVIENFSQKNYDLERLNLLREEIIRPFENFLENRSRTVRKIAEAVYNFLCDINLYEGIKKECEYFDANGLRDLSEQYKQVWNTIIEVLNQTVVATGDDVVSRETFFGYIQNGLTQSGIAIIPSGLDQVSVGTVERNAPNNVKVLFILGALHGDIPQELSASTIFSAFDRAQINEALSKKEKELAPDDLGRIALSNLKLYRTVSTAQNQLLISYPIANSEGNALSPSRFVTLLKKMFPDIKTEDNIISKTPEEELLSSQNRGFYYLLSKPHEYFKKDREKLWEAVFKWYEKKPEYASRFGILETASQYRKIVPRLSRLKAELLFGKGKRYSITALEKYNRCPFSYYLEKGLKAQPQEIKQVEKSHIGSLIHAAICEFCKAVEKGARTVSDIHKNWLSLTDEDASALISAIMQDMREKIMRHVNSDENRIEYLLARCEKTLKKALETVRKSLSQGAYTSVCYEKDFEVNIDWKDETVTLFGTIDRIDVMEKIAENRANIRIVDYKTGHKDFSISAIVNRLDMQLVLYAVAAESLYKKGEIPSTDKNLSPCISAIMYNKINDDMVKIKENDVSLAEKAIKNKGRLDGVIVLDNEDASLDSVITDMDESILDNKESEILNISFNKDGSLSASSQVTSRDTFDSLCQYMKKSAIETHKAIKSGDISITPYKNGQFSPCAYCDYSEICMFDARKSGFRTLISKEDTALEFIRKELSEDE